MDTTDWLITATFAGPVLGALAATGLISAVLSLTRARAQYVKHVPASGADLYRNGVPMTETQFREVFAAYTAELDELPPPSERDEWQNTRSSAAQARLAVLAGTFPSLLPVRSNADDAWAWYASNNRYVTSGAPGDPWSLRGRLGDQPFAPWRRQ